MSHCFASNAPKTLACKTGMTLTPPYDPACLQELLTWNNLFCQCLAETHLNTPGSCQCKVEDEEPADIKTNTFSWDRAEPILIKKSDVYNLGDFTCTTTTKLLAVTLPTLELKIKQIWSSKGIENSTQLWSAQRDGGDLHLWSKCISKSPIMPEKKQRLCVQTFQSGLNRGYFIV